MLQPIDASVGLVNAWQAVCLEGPQARRLAQQALDSAPTGGTAAAWSFWLMAWAEARMLDLSTARGRLQTARMLFVQHEHDRGLAMCDEMEAALALHAGNARRAREIQQALDRPSEPKGSPLEAFVCSSLRALTARRLGEWDEAVSPALAAHEAAVSSGNLAAQATAACLRGAIAFDRFDLPAATQLTQSALELARASGARHLVTAAAGQLLVIHHAAGRASDAQDMAHFLIENPELQTPAALTRVAVPIALACHADGDLERAEAWLESGSSVHPVDGDNTSFWAWLSVRCLLQRKEPALARGLAERSLQAVSAFEPPYHPFQLARAAADACLALGDAPAAQQHEERARAWRQQLSSATARPDSVPDKPRRAPATLRATTTKALNA